VAACLPEGGECSQGNLAPAKVKSIEISIIASSGGRRVIHRLHVLLRKVQRNVQDVGVRITTLKIASYLIRVLYEKRVYRIYGIDLSTKSSREPTHSRFIFQLLRSEDANFIQQIESLAEWLQGNLRNRLEEKNLCLVALDDNIVAGFNLVCLGHISIPLLGMERKLRPYEAWSEQISVRRSYRKHGLGVDLRHCIFEELRRQGIRKFYGATLVNNSAALALARRAGFREIADVHYRKILRRKTMRYKRVRP